MSNQYALLTVLHNIYTAQCIYISSVDSLSCLVFVLLIASWVFSHIINN